MSADPDDPMPGHNVPGECPECGDVLDDAEEEDFCPECGEELLWDPVEGIRYCPNTWEHG